MVVGAKVGKLVHVFAAAARRGPPPARAPVAAEPLARALGRPAGANFLKILKIILQNRFAP